MTKISQKNKGQVRFKAAAEYAESGDIHDTISKLWNGPEDQKPESLDKVGSNGPWAMGIMLTRQEIELLLKRTEEVPIEPHDIISDPKTVVALSLLYNSMVSLSPRHLNTTNILSNGSQVIFPGCAE